MTKLHFERPWRDEWVLKLWRSLEFINYKNSLEPVNIVKMVLYNWRAHKNIVDGGQYCHKILALKCNMHGYYKDDPGSHSEMVQFGKTFGLVDVIT